MHTDKEFTDENINKEEYNKEEDGRIIKGPEDLDNLTDMDKEKEKVEKAKDPLIDPKVEISNREIEDLEQASQDTSSDETQMSENFLDDEDADGALLNEGPDLDSQFDTGQDLDVDPEDLYPDRDMESEDN